MTDQRIMEVMINGSGQYSGEIDYIYNVDLLEKLRLQDLKDVKRRLQQLTQIVVKQMNEQGLEK